MPRTDALDSQGHHNLMGIDLRKNANQNTALDAFNVRVDSAQLFVNRLMPRLYKDKSQKHMFACEARNLSGVDFDYDFTADEESPSILSAGASSIPTAYQKSFSYRIVGKGLSTISNLFITNASDNSSKIGNADFAFVYNKEDGPVDTILLSIVPSPSSKIILISPFGSCSYIVPQP